MNNNKLLPFNRNRYYKGKMLTSVDFESEQRYMNDKRRFLNTMVTGSGIVCGMNVVSLDDQSLLIESGMAIDDNGNILSVSDGTNKTSYVYDGQVHKPTIRVTDSRGYFLQEGVDYTVSYPSGQKKVGQ